MTAIKKIVAPTTASEEKKTLSVKPANALSPVPQTEKKPQEQAKEVLQTKENKIPSLEELKRRAEIVFLLREKHTKLTEKRAMLDKFTISHEKENATATVADAHGLEFTSSSPKTIAKLLEFWKEEFDDAISKIEEELKKNFEFVA